MDPSVAQPSAVMPAWRREGTVYLIGVDGMTLDVIGPLVERGELPNFARLAAEGCSGRIDTISPNNSGLIWTTIATGRHYRDHGIDALEYYKLLGMHVSRLTIRKLNKFGLKLLPKGLQKAGLMTRYTFDARDVRAKTLWEIVSDAGGRVGVVNWHNTWPVHPVNGFIVSDRVQPWRPAKLGIEEPKAEYLTFPEELLDDLRPLLVPPEKVPLEVARRYVNMPDAQLAAVLEREFDKWSVGTELKYALSSDLSTLNVLEYGIEAFAPLNLVFAFFWAMDKIQHAAFRYMPLADEVDVTQRQREEFGRIVMESYGFIDRAVGEVLSRMGPHDTLFVVSDHGFAFEPKRGTYGHKRAHPPGVFYAYGPEFRAGGEVQGATVCDVAPTVLRVCGFGLPQEVHGHCLEHLFTAEFRRQHPPPDPPSTYGPPYWQPAEQGGSPPDDGDED